MSFPQFFFKRMVPCSIAYIGVSTMGSFIQASITKTEVLDVFENKMEALIEEEDIKVDARFSMLHERFDDLQTGQSHIFTAIGKL